MTQELQFTGVGLASLTAKIRTQSPTGCLVFHVVDALAEFEQNLIRECTLAGLKAARALGRSGGRPRKRSSRDLKTVRTLVNPGAVPIGTIAEPFGISHSSIYHNLDRTT